jgi:hypothetical protein
LASFDRLYAAWGRNRRVVRDDPDPSQAAVRRMLSVIKAGLRPTTIT